MPELSDVTPRVRRLLASLRRHTPREVAQRAALRLADGLDAHELEYPLLRSDVADSHDLPTPQPFARASAARPRVAWVAFPPGAGSGGHTTLFRMMESARTAGFANTLLLYDRYGSDLDHKAQIVRSAWPWLDADIAPMPERVTGYDAVVASSWPTAHAVAARTVEGRRLYFVQDFEPLFYPRGAMYALAEDTYRFGFRNIALGRMVHDLLRSETGVQGDLVPFGCDTATYHLMPPAGRRSGVTFYAKRGNDRRGYSLAIRALEVFHVRHPEEPIHVYGDRVDDAAFPAVNHGNLAPEQLNALYNTVVAGLALSFTNISLVAEELLAAGAVPVVNDSPLARADLPNPYATWAEATPTALADALSAAVEHRDRDDHGVRVAHSVLGRSWNPTGEAVAAILAEEIGPPSAAPTAEARAGVPTHADGGTG